MKLNTNFWLESAETASRNRARRQRRISLMLGIALVSECIAVAVYILTRK